MDDTKETPTELIKKHKIMLCRVPKHIYNVWKESQSQNSDQSIGSLVVKPDSTVEMEFNPEMIQLYNKEIKKELNDKFKVNLSK